MVGGGGWVGTGGSQIKTKISPQLGLAKLELGLSLAICLRNPHVTQGVSLNPNLKLSPIPCVETKINEELFSKFVRKSYWKKF